MADHELINGGRPYVVCKCGFMGSRGEMDEHLQTLLDTPFGVGIEPVLIGAHLAGPCEAHAHHEPGNSTIEFHHVVPVAWQIAFPWPDGSERGDEPFPGTDPAGRGHLWDSRRVALCPTGHRNVHFLLVTMMHEVAASGTFEKPRGHGGEANLAQSAIARFEVCGKTPSDLAARGLWGEA